MESLKNKIGALKTGEYLLFIAKTVNSFQQIGTSAVLIINNYNNHILGIILGNSSIYLLDFNNTDKNDNLSSFYIIVLIKFDISY